ncbi:hypothetical protein ABT364_19610 [Massilia sp. SR12]
MHSELQTVDFVESEAPSKSVIPLTRGAAVSDLRSPRMVDVMRIPTTEELRDKMRVLGVPNDPTLRDASPEQKLNALANFGRAYLPTFEVLTFVSTLLAKIREVYRAKRFGGEEFRTYFHATAEVMNGQRLRPLPPCLSSITGTGFALTGPSLMGRTATLQRVVEFLGKPFIVEGDHPAPRQMWVIPILYLSYPTCGTLRGLFRDMRERILAEVGRYDMDTNALSELEGINGENVAIALCTLMNVGVVVLDGGGFANVNGKTEHIFRFLLKLRQFTGVPVLISGTSAFMYSASYMGNLASNLFNGPCLQMNPLRAPSQSNEGNGTVKVKGGVWQQLNTWLWRQGLFDQSTQMPDDLPAWTYKAAYGRPGWLVQGFEALHTLLITKPDLQSPGMLTEKRVLDIFDMKLQLHNSARREAARTGPLSAKGRTSFLKNLDHLSTHDFDEPQVHDWLDEAMLRRV